jgi:hypothetical protein
MRVQDTKWTLVSLQHYERLVEYTVSGLQWLFSHLTCFFKFYSVFSVNAFKISIQTQIILEYKHKTTADRDCYFYISGWLSLWLFLWIIELIHFEPIILFNLPYWDKCAKQPLTIDSWIRVLIRSLFFHDIPGQSVLGYFSFTREIAKKEVSRLRIEICSTLNSPFPRVCPDQGFTCPGCLY